MSSYNPSQNSTPYMEMVTVMPSCRFRSGSDSDSEAVRTRHSEVVGTAFRFSSDTGISISVSSSVEYTDTHLAGTRQTKVIKK